MMNQSQERHFGLIGYPLVHSYSKGFFTEKFRNEGFENCFYHNFPIQSAGEIKALVSENPGLVGLNVTIPHKEAVMNFLDEIDPLAQSIGAVNCILIKNDRLIGHNTDVYGFSMSIKPFLENKYERALILGTGGASKAVAYALKQWGIPFFFVSRNPSGSNVISYEELSAASIGHFRLIINTTPLGTYPEIDDCPLLPYEALSEGHFLYDLIYNPEMTTFLQLGKRAGAAIMNGSAMLRLQAEKSWEIWNSSL
jgi:shikimate dehydrogenase